MELVIGGAADDDDYDDDGEDKRHDRMLIGKHEALLV